MQALTQDKKKPEHETTELCRLLAEEQKKNGDLGKSLSGSISKSLLCRFCTADASLVRCATDLIVIFEVAENEYYRLRQLLAIVRKERDESRLAAQEAGLKAESL